MTALSDIQQSCSKVFYEICTTSQFPSLSFHSPSFLLAGAIFPFLVLCFAAQGFPFLVFVVYLQVQSLAFSFVKISPWFWQHIDRRIQVKRCRGSPYQFRCTDVDHCNISESGVTRSPGYSALYAWYEIFWCTPTLSGPFLDVEWSILCTSHHSFSQGNIVP